MLDSLIDFCKRMAALGMDDRAVFKFSRNVTNKVNSAIRVHNAEVENRNERIDVDLEGLTPYEWVDRNMMRHLDAYSAGGNDSNFHLDIQSEIDAYWTKEPLIETYSLPGEEEAKLFKEARLDGIKDQLRRTATILWNKEREEAFAKLRSEESETAAKMSDCVTGRLARYRGESVTGFLEILGACQESNMHKGPR